MGLWDRDHTQPGPNKQRIRMLVEALRSGKYRQTQRKLARYDRKGRKKKYCCLGVACEVARLSGLPIQIKLDPATDTYSYGGREGALPLKVVEWFGFDSTNPFVDTDYTVDPARHRFTLAELNDDYDRSFKQIADIIEAHFLPEDKETDDDNAK